MDLKRLPARIEDIPELTTYVELFRFVRDANLQDSVFRTAGCDIRVSSDEGIGWKYRSFIHLLFEILHWNTSRKCYLLLFDEFKRWTELRKYEDVKAGVDFTLGPTSFWDHGFDGYSLRVYVEGCGGSEPDARAAWAMALASLSAFLEDFSRRYQPQLHNCLKRIS
jgi:hypothetical protein